MIDIKYNISTLIGVALFVQANICIISATNEHEQEFEKHLSIIFDQGEEGIQRDQVEFSKSLLAANELFNQLDGNSMNKFKDRHDLLLQLMGVQPNGCHRNSFEKIERVMKDFSEYRKCRNIVSYLNYCAESLISECIDKVNKLDNEGRYTNQWLELDPYVRQLQTLNKFTIKFAYLQYLKSLEELQISTIYNEEHVDTQTWLVYKKEFIRKLGEIFNQVCPKFNWKERDLTEAITEIEVDILKSEFVERAGRDNMRKLKNMFICSSIANYFEIDIFEDYVYESYKDGVKDMVFKITDLTSLGPQVTRDYMEVISDVRLNFASKAEQDKSSNQAWIDELDYIANHWIPIENPKCNEEETKLVASNSHTTNTNIRSYYDSYLPQYITICTEKFRLQVLEQLRIAGIDDLSKLVTITDAILSRFDFQKQSITKEEIEAVASALELTHIRSNAESSVRTRDVLLWFKTDVCPIVLDSSMNHIEASYDVIVELLSFQVDKLEPGISALMLTRSICRILGEYSVQRMQDMISEVRLDRAKNSN